MLTHQSATDFGRARHRAPVVFDVAAKPGLLLRRYDRPLAPASIAGSASVFLTGIGIGLLIGIALFLSLPAPVDREALLESAERFWNATNRSIMPAATPATYRSFSPKSEFANLKGPAPHHSERSSSSTVKGVHAAETAPTPALGTTVMGWQPVVANTVGAVGSGSAATSLTPGNPTSRYKLVVEIQRKLKKRGCYWGRISGSWGAGTKVAMQAFIDRVNGTSSIKQPNYEQLRLLQTNSETSCGACPAGQSATVGGNCMPQTTIADAQRKPGGGRQGGDDVLPWKRTGALQPAAQPLRRPAGTTIVTTTPLSGRMAIGGPQQQPSPSAENDSQPSSVAAITSDPLNDSDVSRPSLTRAPSVRPRRSVRRARAARRKAKRSRQRHRGVQAARRHNLMLSLGGAN